MFYYNLIIQFDKINYIKVKINYVKVKRIDIKREINKLYLVNNSHVKLAHMLFKSARIRTFLKFNLITLYAEESLLFQF